MIEKETLSFYFASACMVLLPIYVWYIPPFMILWGCSRIIEIRFTRSSKKLSFSYSSLLFIMFLTFYIWQFVGLIYSENIKTGWSVVFSRLSLVFFPLILLNPGEKILINIRFLLKLFSISTAVYILICFIHAIIVSISLSNGEIIFNPHPPEGYWMSYFFGNYFSINQHPSYLAMYVTFSALYSFESGFYQFKKPKSRYLWFGLGIFLLVSLYFLSSRSGLLGSLILIPAYFIYRFKNNRNKILLLLLLIFFVLIPVLSTNVRVKIIIDEVSNKTLMNKVNEDGRLNIWKSAIIIIRNNTLLGVGIGDVRDELHKEYVKIGNQDLINNNYNVHNQFLEVFVESGLVGLTLFLLILFIMLVIAYKDRNLLLALFVFMMILSFMFETVLYRLAGVTFFSLLPFLLIYNQEKRG